MADLVVTGLDDALYARLQAIATRRGLPLQDVVREALEQAVLQDGRPSVLNLAASLRAGTRGDPAWNSAAEIRAEREARTARLLGEDPEEAWARGYREALDATAAAPGTVGPRGDAA